MTQCRNIEEEILEPREWEWRWWPSLWWNRSPAHLLKSIEEHIFSRIHSKTDGFYVEFDGDFFEDSGNPCRIWTRKFVPWGEEEEDSSPIVMVHGMGAGQALFAMNLDGLSERRTVFCLDLPGFSRSSRNRFSSDAATCESQLVEALERWRSSLGIEKMNLCAHSFGGYVGTAYALEHPDRLNHLILADPWGFLDRPADPFRDRGKAFRLLLWVAIAFNPLAVLRLIGRLAPSLARSFRKDLAEAFSDLWEDQEENVIVEYIVHSNFHSPTGESAFHTLMDYFGWAKRPMIHRIYDLDPNLPLTAIFGGRSWMGFVSTEDFQGARSSRGGYSKSTKVEGAPHHVYTRVDDFNGQLLDACRRRAA